MVHHLPALLQLHVLDDEDGEGEGHVGPGENEQTELDLAEGDLALVLEDFLLPSPLQLQREADEDVAHEDEKEGDEEDDAEDESSREETLSSEWSTLIGLLHPYTIYCALIGCYTTSYAIKTLKAP